jgi:hypothetical protein
VGGGADGLVAQRSQEASMRRPSPSSRRGGCNRPRRA